MSVWIAAASLTVSATTAAIRSARDGFWEGVLLGLAIEALAALERIRAASFDLAIGTLRRLAS